eukprot:g8642.t1
MGSRHARLARRRERGSRYGMIHGRGGERGGQQYRKETDLRRTGNLFVRSPVPATSHDGSLDREAEFAAKKEKMEAFELAEERR